MTGDAPLKIAIGLVTHPRSRFTLNAGSAGTAATMVTALEARGATVALYVAAKDAFAPATTGIPADLLRASGDAQRQAALAWAAYLGPPTGMVKRIWRATAAAAARKPGRAETEPPDAAVILRLLNIEASHLNLMRRACDDGAEWLLLLEDDAHACDISDAADGLVGLIADADGQPLYVDVSTSYTLAALGIEHLVAPSTRARWQGRVSRAILEASKPVTNTVCAVLYRTDWLRDLIPLLERRDEQPILPIDWAINEALIELVRRGRLGDGDCWMVSPGPFRQLSLS